VNFQSEKTLNPEKRKIWLNEEWRLKIDGFKNEFNKVLDALVKDSKCLCIGARTGQEVVALNELGITNVIGLDLVPHSPHVIKGDMHNLEFENESFNFVYSNVLGNSVNPEKMISEIERVLVPGGICYLQFKVGEDRDQYTECMIESPIHDICTLFNKSFCVGLTPIQRNFSGMNFEMCFQKDSDLCDLFDNYGSVKTIDIPQEYEEIWNDINLPIQVQKLDSSGIISEKLRKEILDGLSRRAYYLTRVANQFKCKNIAEVGTAEGWQFYTFCKYARDPDVDGSVFSCDPRDVRHKKYVDLYKDDQHVSFTNGISINMSLKCKDIDMFYIDGLHDEGSIFQDIENLQKSQKEDGSCVWVFDDFDERFGCFKDILTISQFSRCFKVYNIGQTASGKPSHQVIIKGTFKI
jgi:SAM-dependent methyltransferase